MNPVDLPLRDIHLPDAIGWWPPAPGWWVLAVLTIALAIFLTIRWRRQRALQRSAAYLARLELEQIKGAWHEHHNASQLAQDISSWLRRAAMSLRTREQAASLTGERWWQFLDELGGSKLFATGGGRLISDAPYRPDAQVDAKELMTLCDQWVDNLLEAQKGARL